MMMSWNSFSPQPIGAAIPDLEVSGIEAYCNDILKAAYSISEN
jgi:hypothetical protein